MIKFNKRRDVVQIQPQRELFVEKEKRLNALEASQNQTDSNINEEQDDSKSVLRKSFREVLDDVSEDDIESAYTDESEEDFEEDYSENPKSFSETLDDVSEDDIECDDTDESEEDFEEEYSENPKSLSQILKDVSEDDCTEKLEEDSKAQSEDEDVEGDEEILIKASANKIKRFRHKPPRFTKETLEYIAGIPTIPLSIDSYESIDITNEEAAVIKKVGIPSLDIGERGAILHVKVIGTKNCLAILNAIPDNNTLEWISDFICLENKTKGTDGAVYADVIVSDELSTKKVTIPISKITDSNKVKTLSNYDVHINTFKTLTVAIALKKLLENLPIKDKNKELGVVFSADSETKLAFNGYNTADSFEVRNEFSDYDEYIENLNELIKPSVPIQFLISATMGATILTILQEAFNYDLHSYSINIVGSSSTGKTISSQVAASMWTNPNSDKIFSAMLSTTNAALKRLSGRNGIPTFLDEASAVADNFKISEFVYQIYEQCEKHRLNSDCSEKTSGKWSTVVTMTSEQRFALPKKNQNGGISVRLHIIDNQMWTTDKDHADNLMKFVRKNYGVVGERFTKMLFSDTDLFNKIPEHYEEAREIITKRCQKHRNDFTDRLCQTYAITIMTAFILNQYIGLDLDLNKIVGVLVRHNQYVAKEQNLALNAYRAIISYVTRNPGKPGIRKVFNEDKIDKYVIEASLMNDILNNNGFQDVTVAIKALDDAGFLIRQGEKQKGLKSKLTVNGILCQCYQIDAKIQE